MALSATLGTVLARLEHLAFLSSLSYEAVTEAATPQMARRCLLVWTRQNGSSVTERNIGR